MSHFKRIEYASAYRMTYGAFIDMYRSSDTMLSSAQRRRSGWCVNEGTTDYWSSDEDFESSGWEIST